MKNHFSAHPWHGVSLGESAPHEVTAYIEIVPTDVVKYELDKTTGLLKVDRPNKYSSQCPTLYGFLPQTYSGPKVAAYCSKRSGIRNIEGDGDPLDICVLAERPIQHHSVLLTAVPIGGLRLIDRQQADDKIIAVLHQDGVYGSWSDIKSCPSDLLDRLQHYFLTYKQLPSDEARKVEIVGVYGAKEAREVITLGVEDYLESFGTEPRGILPALSKKPAQKKRA